jgi:regulator of sigma E protease
MISVSLGLMNLLPIPPLDGGRFLIEIVQKIIRRDVSPSVIGYISMAGMALFFGFFMIMLNQDIQRFILGTM